MFQTKVVEKIGTQILCPIPFFFPRSLSLENRALCEILWKNTVEREGPQMKK